MKDPICGMTVKNKDINIVVDGKEYFFCSQHCKETFIKRGLSKSCASCLNKKNLFFENKLLIITTLIALLIFLSYFVKFLVPFRENFIEYLKKIWWAILLGLFISGIIDFYIPSEYISKILSKRKISTVFKAVFLGFLASTCSHGILAIAIQLHKKGASNFSVVSFLLSSPWANFSITLILVSLFGLKGISIIILSLIVAINTGIIFMFLERKNLIEKNKNTVEIQDDFSVSRDFLKNIKNFKFSSKYLITSIKGIFKGIMSLSDMLLWWLLLGMFIASLVASYIPVHFFHRFMGPNLVGLFITLILATVIEVCSEGSAPLAFEIYRKTNALGNSFVFLSSGVATDYTEIGLLWMNVGKKVAMYLPAISVPQILFFGYLMNIFFK